MRDLCYWSIGDRDYGPMMQTLVRSFRAVGMEEDFHAFSDRPIEGAISHPIGSFNKAHYLFKPRFLKEEVAKLDYRYFAFLDADNYFVRKPPNVLDLMNGSPVHSFLESDFGNPGNVRGDWWSCSMAECDRLMRERGVLAPRIYNVNAGFFIVHRDAVDTVYRLMMEFWEHCRRAGYTFTEEAPLAYATQMLCVDPEPHRMREHFDTWACDWTGEHAGRLPDGHPFTFHDYFTGERHQVNPAIVHAMRSKEAMIRAGAATL